ncbi:Zeaxanthin epoxidase, chloroplastic [Fusarium agapanthi]|uniref:Zeaxanthin epoxidase, chloroplastic n=1 Tax=Fusarium agapanthi TaxID=1803897 RepID=A0A9P5BCE3_9HYPO|nr:Zeaxanthin epoxidase, chloroplastic [Fusarium agapanthi]
MADKHPFRVLIVGASVTGLSLANMLQANGIDFLVLEAYPTVAPQVGASIGLLPHGNRILDQLSLYEKVMEIAPPIQVFNFRDINGQILARHGEMDERIIERHGYPMVFLDRQMLLQVLYKSIKDKTKILTNKRVVRAELVNGGVHAVTSDGTIIAGDILVGADGVNSAVRSGMWKLAGRLSPGLFDPNEHEAPPCENSCIFGISNPCPGINPGDLHCVFRNSSSYLVTGGSQGRVYWFRFQKLQKRVHGSAIPRYSEKDLQKALSESADDNILPDLMFSTLLDNKVSAVMTPLVEYVYKQWHFDRIITLGDSAHKFHPVGGQGGNAAIESAALLTNNLVGAIKRSPSGRLTTVQVESIFADVQSRRKPRLALNHRYSHNRSNTEALDTPLKKLIAIHMLPLVDEQVVTLGYCSQHPGGEMLDMLPVKHHENLIPYKQELLCEPMSRGSLQWVLVMTYAIFAVVAASAGKFGPTSTDGSVPNNYPKSIMGVESALYQFPPTWTDKASILSLEPLTVYAFGNFLQPIAIIMIEGYRGRNKLTPLGLPALWLMLIQYAGIGVAMPLYYLVYTLISDVEFYWWPLRRFVALRHARHILSAYVMAEAINFGLVLSTTHQPKWMQAAKSFWPLIVPVLVGMLGSFGSHQTALNPSKTLKVEVKTLGRIYLAAGLFSSLCHWFAITQAARNVDLNMILNFSRPPRLDQSLHIPAAQHVGIFVVGRANMSLFTVSLWILLALVSFGPGASVAGVCKFNFSHSQNMEEHAPQPSAMPARPGSRKRVVAPVISVLTLCLFVNLSMSLYQLPSNRLIERRLCIDYYRQNDPSRMQPGGSVDEKLCKIREIEKDLGRIQGVMETLWVAGDFVMTIPLSFLAEKWGRRAILRLNLLSRSFMLLWAIIVGSFDTLLPTKAIVVGPVLSVLGGDCVFNSLTYGLVSNLTDDHVQRAIYFGYMSSVSYVVALLGPALASSTMTLSLWLPFWLGIFLLSLAVPTIQMLPMQGNTDKAADGDDESQHEPLLSSPRIKAQSHQEPLLQSVINRLQTIKNIIVSHPKNFSLLLFGFMLTSLASSDTKLLVQYISARYKWTFASAGYLLSGKAIVNFTLLAIVIPKILRSAHQIRHEDASEVADKSNIRNAQYCLVASVFGALGIAIASEIWMLIPSMFVYALGSALPIFTLSLLKSPVISPPHSSDSSDPEPHIFSIVMLVKTVGSLLGAPLMAALWVRGLGIGGMALGMPFFVSQACYAVAIWVFVNIEVDRDVLAAAERRRRNRD